MKLWCDYIFLAIANLGTWDKDGFKLKKKGIILFLWVRKKSSIITKAVSTPATNVAVYSWNNTPFSSKIGRYRF